MTNTSPASEKSERKSKTLRTTGLCILAFLLMISYALARPAVESMFLQAHTSKRLPLVWLITAAAALAAVALYNRLVKNRHLVIVYGSTSIVSAGILAFLLLGLHINIPYVNYGLYVWKDIYVVVLVEIFYTYANTVFPIRTARWVYGLFGATASIGSILGNLAVGRIAVVWGSAAALWIAAGLLIFIGCLCFPLSRMMGKDVHPRAPDSSTLLDAFKTVRNSKYLLLILTVVALVQVSITLVDYQFNVVLESAYSDMNVRTGIIGKVYAVIAFSTVFLNVLAGPILRLAGVGLTLVLIPFFLFTALSFFAFFPRFVVGAILKAASKSFDYTLFRAAKEILYIPADYTEKTQGKSIADMLTYRVAKGGASLLLLALSVFSASWTFLPITFMAIGGWFAASVAVTRRFRLRVRKEDELRKHTDSG